MSQQLGQARIGQGSPRGAAIKAKGFVAMKELSAYKAAYKYNQTHAYVMVFSDHQGDGGIYGIQVFDKTVQSDLDSNGDSGETLDFHVECGFAYSITKVTYMTVDLYVLN